MTFLKKLGGILLKIGQIVVGFGPMLSTAIPQIAGAVQVVSRDIAAIAQIIMNVEAIGAVLGIAGPDKLRAAAPLVAQIVLQSEILVNKTIANPELFQKGCTEIAGGMADILNSLDESHVESVSKLAG